MVYSFRINGFVKSWLFTMGCGMASTMTANGESNRFGWRDVSLIHESEWAQRNAADMRERGPWPFDLAPCVCRCEQHAEQVPPQLKVSPRSFEFNVTRCENHTQTLNSKSNWMDKLFLRNGCAKTTNKLPKKTKYREKKKRTNISMKIPFSSWHRFRQAYKEK